ncbi:MAG: amidohydrolase family protein, partial [Gammaproteobacteria bacterium]
FRTIAGGCILVALSMTASSQALLMRGATIYTMAGVGTIFYGDLLINQDRIAAVGEDLSAHPLALNAEEIDVSGLTITPGFIVPWTPVGAVGWPTGGYKSFSQLHSAGYSVEQGWTYRSDTVQASLASGVMAVGTVPYNDQELFSGIAVAGTLRPDEQPLLTEFALVARLSSFDGHPFAAVNALEQAIEDVKRYRRNTLSYERGGHFDFSLSRKDMHAIQRVLDGEIRLIVQANGAEEIRRLIHIANREKLRLIIAGGGEADVVATELASNGIPVILQPHENYVGATNPASQLTLASKLNSSGVVVMFGSDAYIGTELVRLAASQAVGWGLPSLVALRALTVNAAAVLGMPDRGQISSGKIADLVIWDGDPLETSSTVTSIMLAGKTYKPTPRSFLLGERYLKVQRGNNLVQVDPVSVAKFLQRNNAPDQSPQTPQQADDQE